MVKHQKSTKEKVLLIVQPAVTFLLFLILDIPIFLSDFFATMEQRLIAHTLLCIAFILIYKLIEKTIVDVRYFILFFLFALTLGPPGALVIILSFILFFFYILIIQPLSNLLYSLFPVIIRDPADIAYERIIYHLDDFRPDRVPIPFKDIMRFGSYRQKRMAIEKMLRYYRPEFAESLKIGLTDKSSSVKVQAATAISYIDHKLFTENIKLKQQYEESPDDKSLLRKYAKNCADYAFSGILDPDRERKIINNGIEAYKEYLSENHHDDEAKLDLAKLKMKVGEYAKANTLLSTIHKKKLLQTDYLLRLQCLFYLRDYHGLKEEAKRLKAEGPFKGELQSMIDLWTNDHE